MLVLALLPSRMIRWVEWVAQPVEALVAPVQAPIQSVVAWLLPAAHTRDTDDAQVADLRRELAEMRTLYLSEQQSTKDLRRQLADLQLGASLNPDLVVQQLPARVIGGGADLAGGMLKVQAGTSNGVANNSVAVVGGVHLVGRVTRADLRMCYVVPITEPAAGPVQGTIMLADTIKGPLCHLTPKGDGTLRGLIADGSGTPADIKPGMVVRLDDREGWPPSAQMLVIGAVERVDPADQPLHRIVTVRPPIRPDRLSELVIRILETSAPRSGSGGGPP